MPPDDARRRLQRAEDELVRALVAGAETPAGHDPAAIARARTILGHKKAWVDARRSRGGGAWSRLRRALGLG